MAKSSELRVRLDPNVQRDFIQRFRRDDRKSFERRPELKRAIVTAVDAGSVTITVKFPDPTSAVNIPEVACVGWGGITLPVVDDEVWVLDVDNGNPIALGMLINSTSGGGGAGASTEDASALAIALGGMI